MKSVIILVTSLLFALSVQAFEVGQNLPDTAFEDQFEASMKVQPDTKTVVLVFDKDVSKMITEYLIQSQVDPAKLNAVVVSDISAMPTLVTKMFALPKMKKYHFKMALDKSGELTKSWPRQSGKATVLPLDNFKITKVDYISTTEQIQSVFKVN